LVADVVAFCKHEPVVEMDSVASIGGYIQDQAVKAVLCDLMMPRMDGIEVLEIWMDARPEVRRVLITAAPKEERIREALLTGVIQMVIEKPPQIADIRMALAWL
jgi:response regulator of citrate/malate metabolism